MDRQTRQGGEPAAFRGAASDMDLGRPINDVSGIDADTCDAERVQSEYYPDRNNSMERALGHAPDQDLEGRMGDYNQRRRSESE